jgi:hypothetical protein
MSSVLTTQQFLELVLPDTGPYCVAYPVVTKAGNKAYAHVACKTVADAVSAARNIYLTKQRDAYFAVHGLLKGAIWNQEKQRFIVSRKHDNMRECKCFFADLDVGVATEKTPKYKTRAEALEALERFLFRTRLPTPMVVSSGGGYHIYWLLDRSIPSAEWRALADRLRWLAATNGLKVDPARTTDQSSVLRVVGTKNYKPDVQAMVEALVPGDITDTDDFVAMLTEKTENFTPLATLVSKATPEQVGNLGTQFDGRLTPVEEVYEHCAQMRHVRDSEGMVPEPEWNDFIHTMLWAENGEEEIHEVSKGDPRYDEAETQTKIERARKFSAVGCAKIELNSANGNCQSCPLRGQGKNPLDIANKQWAKTVQPAAKPTPQQLQQGVQPIVAPCLPPRPYTLGNGGVSVARLDPAQQAVVEKMFLPYHLFPVAKYKGTRGEPGYSMWCVTLPLEGQQVFRVDDEALHSMQSFPAAMLGAGIILTNPINIAEARSYMLHYLATLQKHTIAAKLHDHYGWDYEDDGRPTSKQAFILHDRAFDLAKKEWLPCAMASNMKGGDQWMNSDGTLGGYMAALQFYNRPQYRHAQFLILSGMCAPFFYATGEHGVIVSAHGPSGASKSSALFTAAAMWGNPKTYVINGSPNGATQNARTERMAMLPNLPVCMDEITAQSSEAINDMALSIGQIGGKLRLDAKSQFKTTRGGVCNHPLLVSTNTSMHAQINAVNLAGQAASARVIELSFPKGQVREKTAADAMMRAIRANYGHLGPAVLTALLPDHKAIEEEIHQMSDRLNLEWKLQPAERFFGFTVACLLVVASRATSFGLQIFDLDALKEWIETVQLPLQRANLENQAERASPQELLANYILKHQGEAVRCELDSVGNIGGTISAPLSREAAYRFDIGRKEIWIRCEHFRHYLVQLTVDPSVVASTLTRLGIIKERTRRNLFEGMPNYPGVRTFCYIVDMTHTKVKGVAAQMKSQP